MLDKHTLPSESADHMTQSGTTWLSGDSVPAEQADSFTCPASPTKLRFIILNTKTPLIEKSATNGMFKSDIHSNVTLHVLIQVATARYR